ncbi:hypothetical protein H0O00_04225 [Candidatus Micrarchaeota archaeon]|nr:hypothetical protein [Candidatus Micrarchaeota archaeon]
MKSFVAAKQRVGFVAAGQRVEVASKSPFWLEVIHEGNMDKRRMMPNRFFNEVLHGRCDKCGELKSIPDEFMKFIPFHTGTFGVIGATGKELGRRAESRSVVLGSWKTVIAELDKEDAALVNTIVACDHGFMPDGTPTLALFDARTEKPICSDEDMGEASEVLMKLNGQIQRLKVPNRHHGVFEAVGDDQTYLWAHDNAAMGLVGRYYNPTKGYDPTDRNALRWDVCLLDLAGSPGILMEAIPRTPVEKAENVSPGSTAPAGLKLTHAGEKLIIEGTPQQLKAAVGLLDCLLKVRTGG